MLLKFQFRVSLLNDLNHIRIKIVPRLSRSSLLILNHSLLIEKRNNLLIDLRLRRSSPRLSRILKTPILTRILKTPILSRIPKTPILRRIRTPILRRIPPVTHGRLSFQRSSLLILNHSLLIEKMNNLLIDLRLRRSRSHWKNENIFQKPYIFLPIGGSDHWSLVIVSMPSKEDDFGPMMLHLDSLHSDFHRCHVSESIFNNVRSFLVEEWELLKKEGLPELPLAENIWNELSQRIGQKVLKVPQQTNGYDCGLFVLFFIERFINDVPERLKTQHLDMLQKEWFKPEEASELRSRIRDLLKQEFKEANVIPTAAV